jgi:hypothetical protein
MQAFLKVLMPTVALLCGSVVLGTALAETIAPGALPHLPMLKRTGPVRPLVRERLENRGSIEKLPARPDVEENSSQRARALDAARVRDGLTDWLNRSESERAIQPGGARKWLDLRKLPHHESKHDNHDPDGDACDAEKKNRHEC